MKASTMAASARQRLDRLAARYWRFECEEIQLTAALAGEPLADATLLRESAGDWKRRDRRAGRLLEALDAIARRPRQRVDRGAIRRAPTTALTPRAAEASSVVTQALKPTGLLESRGGSTVEFSVGWVAGLATMVRALGGMAASLTPGTAFALHGKQLETLMDSSGTSVWLLALVTFVIVLAVAIWQRRSVAKAKDTHEHSAMTEGRPDQRKSDGSDPGTKPH